MSNIDIKPLLAIPLIIHHITIPIYKPTKNSNKKITETEIRSKNILQPSCKKYCL